jgi:hypothetical protein
MKWIKHQTCTWDDERIAGLVGDGGQAGLALYGAYWRVQEILAAQMDGPDPTCSVQYSFTRWSVLMSLRGSHVSHYLGQLEKKGLVTVEWNGSDIRVTNRKLLKYRDEYSRKSGHSSENIRPRTDTDTEQSKKKKKTPARSVPPEELAGTLPLVDGTLYEISKAQVSEWAQAFPAVDVKTELKQFKVWLDANPTKKKTPKGICRAIVGWLTRSQDKGGRLIAMPAAPFPAAKSQYQLDAELQRAERRQAIREAGIQ